MLSCLSMSLLLGDEVGIAKSTDGAAAAVAAIDDDDD
jgi:hypothetical protein